MTSTLVTGSAATTNQRTGARRLRYHIQNTLLEQLGIGEKQRCIPAKEDEAGYLAGVRIACDVVIALDALRRGPTPQSAGANHPTETR